MKIIQNGFQRLDTGEIHLSTHENHFAHCYFGNELYGKKGGFEEFQGTSEHKMARCLCLRADSPIEEIAEKVVVYERGNWVFLKDCKKNELEASLKSDSAGPEIRVEAIKKAATHLLEKK